MGESLSEGELAPADDGDTTPEASAAFRVEVGLDVKESGFEDDAAIDTGIVTVRTDVATEEGEVSKDDVSFSVNAAFDGDVVCPVLTTLVCGDTLFCEAGGEGVVEVLSTDAEGMYVR